MTAAYTASAAVESCYHCGLPIPRGSSFFVSVDGEDRPLCCAGCQAVAETITGCGLVAYYRSRSTYAARQYAAARRDELALYDLPEVQRAFVRSTGNTRETTLILEGITCAACIWLNEQHLSRLPGVLSVEINYTTRRARVRWEAETVALSEILAQIASIGYGAWPATSAAADEMRSRETRAALWRLFVAGFAMMQVMMYAVPAYLDDDSSMTGDIRLLMRLASLVLTVPVVVYSAAPFFRGAWRDLRLRRLGMDVPVALGVAVGFVASVVATFTSGTEVYFDSLTMFVFFLLCGRYLELRARHKAAASLEYLDKALPLAAHRLGGFPGSLDTEEIPAISLRRGDFVLVRPGDSFPADGTLVQGKTESDESLLTGESRAIRKHTGSEITAGAVNRVSPVVMLVERVGEDTRIWSIQRLVERASAERPRLLEATNRIAGWFVAGVLLVAAASVLFWLRTDPSRALWVAVAVLVVTCPCALSLATPAALTVAVGSLARRGVIAGRGHAVEALARVTHVVFDKTGTLTEGHLALLAVHPLGDLSRECCLALAGTLEQGSEHPIAAALLQFPRADPGLALDEHKAIVRDRRNVPGAGVEARVDAKHFRVGIHAFVAAIAGRPPVVVLPENESATRIWLGTQGQWLACFDLADRLRPEAETVVQRLRDAGKQVLILSGDALPAVRAVAQRLGIERFEAGMSPEDKYERVLALQQRGAIVAMVGDGVNDAPVLAQAQLSVAMGSGALLSQAQADIVLVSGRLAGLADAFDIAQRTWRVVRQNLAWAVAYNAVVLPLAVAGLVTPWMAGVGMASSSLLVVLNALRLMHPSTVVTSTARAHLAKSSVPGSA